VNRKVAWRYNFLGGVIFVLPLLIVFQVVRIKFNPENVEKLIAEGKNLSKEYQVVVPARGRIYDRFGQILAANKKAYEVGIELYDVQDPETIAQTLSMVLDLDYMTVKAIADLEPSRNAVYVPITKNVSQEYVDQLNLLINKMGGTNLGSGGDVPDLSGLVFRPYLQRIYPEKELASPILGFVSTDGRSFFGVEEKYHTLLASEVKEEWVPLDPNKVEEREEVPEGASLVLTIDREIQRSMEEVVDEALGTTGADSGTIVVINPSNGELLAVATTPRMDLNEYWKYEKVFQDETFFNSAVSKPYEPGSVYKVLTMACALNSGSVSPETEFIDSGSITVGGTRIYNWDMGAWGPQNMQGCMQHSLNVCLAWVAKQIGHKDFYQCMQDFGIGGLTGVDIAGEVPGRLKVPGDEDWYEADLGTNSFGQGVAATPIQMATAISAVANNGRMMAPHVVHSVINEGFQHDIEKRLLNMPIQETTSQTLSHMLARSLEKESSNALLTGYRLAGKTGTAEIPTPYGYTSNQTNASFVGWGPLEDPQFLIYVWLEKPKTSPWGSVVAAPVFKEAAKQLVILLDIPPDDLRKQINADVLETVQ